MRFSTCLKIVQLSGIFWNQKLLPYNIKWCGWGFAVGPKKTLRLTYARFSDGVFAMGFIRHRPLLQSKFQDIGFFLLQYTTPFLSVIKPWAWSLLVNVESKSYAGFRLRRGLPARGQRTRSNRSTVRKLKDYAAHEFYNEGYGPLCGFAASRKVSLIVKRSKGKGGKSKTTTGGKKKPPVRSAKKPNVWR